MSARGGADERTELDADPAADYGALAAAGASQTLAADIDRGDATRGDEAEEKVPLKPVKTYDNALLATPATASSGGDTPVAMDTTDSPQPLLDRPAQRAKHRRRSALERLNAWLMQVGPGWLSHAEIQKHLKLILIANFFCTFGFVLCLVGITLTSLPPHATYNLVFIVGGFVIFVPGIYYLVYVIRAYHGAEGYEFDNLPPMD